MSIVPPDYDSDPGRWRSWTSPRDVHEMLAPQLRGPILDLGCGEGRLASLLSADIDWVGVDYSPAQLAANPYRPLIQADMRALPFRDGVFTEVAQLWCLYHLANPTVAIREAARVLAPDGRYFACTAARDNDPEIMPEGYPASPFDAEEAVEIIASAFEHVEAQPWEGKFFPLRTRDDVRAYCRHNYIPTERADQVEVPLWLTKRGVLVRATNPRPPDN